MKILVGILVFCFLNGCTVASRIQHDVVDFNRAVESTSNEVAFLNVLRSYKRMPRHYTTISALQGNLKVTAGADLTSTFNPGKNRTNVMSGDGTETGGVASSTTLSSIRDVYVPKLSGSVTSNPSYTVGVLESQEFYKGLLKPIDVATIALFASQGWDSELIMNLFIEGISFKYSSGPPVYLSNEIDDKRWRELANLTRLTATTKTVDPVFIADEISLTDIGVARLYQAGLTVQRCDQIDKNSKSPCTIGETNYIAGEPSSAIALNSDLLAVYQKLTAGECKKKSEATSVEATEVKATEDKATIRLSTDMLFTNPTAGNQVFSTAMVPTSTPAGPGEIKKCQIEEVTLITRSTDGIIYYIGEYLRKIGSPVANCNGEDGIDGHVDEIKVDGTDPMFRICPALSSDGKLAGRVEDEYWVIPKNTENVTTRSMQVLGLIQQLVNLNKSSKDLPKPTFIQVN